MQHGVAGQLLNICELAQYHKHCWTMKMTWSIVRRQCCAMSCITTGLQMLTSRTPTFLNQVLLVTEIDIHVKKLNCRSGLKQLDQLCGLCNHRASLSPTSTCVNSIISTNEVTTMITHNMPSPDQQVLVQYTLTTKVDRPFQHLLLTISNWPDNKYLFKAKLFVYFSLSHFLLPHCTTEAVATIYYHYNFNRPVSVKHDSYI
jgi:hypothetical protein